MSVTVLTVWAMTPQCMVPLRPMVNPPHNTPYSAGPRSHSHPRGTRHEARGTPVTDGRFERNEHTLIAVGEDIDLVTRHPFYLCLSLA